MSKSAVVMDTSALIDGRILDVARAKFVSGRVIIGKCVLDELQLLADGRDTHKRERARYGLDTVNELKKISHLKVTIDDYLNDQQIPTDEKVLKLAKYRSAKLCTTDFNLNKVAVAEGVLVLNVNELARAIRPKMLPGEEIEVKIVQKGDSRGQGVGYLEDGTMTVVEDALKDKGRIVVAVVDRMIQTEAGKMIFASYPKKKK